LHFAPERRELRDPLDPLWAVLQLEEAGKVLPERAGVEQGHARDLEAARCGRLSRGLLVLVNRFGTGREIVLDTFDIHFLAEILRHAVARPFEALPGGIEPRRGGVVAPRA